MSPAEWDDTPWWEQRAYIENMIEDKTLSDPNNPNDDDEERESSPMGNAGQFTDFSGDADFSGFGFSQETL